MHFFFTFLLNPWLGLGIIFSVIIIFFTKKTDNLLTVLKKLAIACLVYLIVYISYFIITLRLH